MAVHNQIKKWMLDQIAGQTIKAMLLTSSHTSDIDTQDFIADVSANEASGTGYTAGGQTLANVTVTERDASNDAILDADDPSWPNSTITARYVCFYIDTGTPATSPIISIQDLGSEQSSNSGAFTLQIPAGGLFDQN